MCELNSQNEIHCALRALLAVIWPHDVKLGRPQVSSGTGPQAGGGLRATGNIILDNVCYTFCFVWRKIINHNVENQDLKEYLIDPLQSKSNCRLVVSNQSESGILTL